MKGNQFYLLCILVTVFTKWPAVFSLLMMLPDQWDEINVSHLFITIITVFTVKLQMRDPPVGPQGLINERFSDLYAWTWCSIPKICLCPTLVNYLHYLFRSSTFWRYSRFFPLLLCLISKEKFNFFLSRSHDSVSSSSLPVLRSSTPHSLSGLLCYLPPNSHASSLTSS